MPEPETPRSPASPSGLLSYRAVRYFWVTGIAPRWIDLLLIMATGVFVFVGIGGMVMCFFNKSPQPLVAAVPAWGIVAGLFWWSNHFRHRQLRSVEDEPSPATPAVQPVAVLPVLPVLPVTPVSALVPASEPTAVAIDFDLNPPPPLPTAHG